MQMRPSFETCPASTSARQADETLALFRVIAAVYLVTSRRILTHAIRIAKLNNRKELVALTGDKRKALLEIPFSELRIQ